LARGNGGDFRIVAAIVTVQSFWVLAGGGSLARRLQLSTS
jgi:hypothetical protein